MTDRQPPCILIVTDEPLIRHMVCRLLSSQGYWPVVADGGEADFEEFSAVPLSLILVNSYRPDLSGSDAVARVTASFPGVPVLHLEEASSRPFDLDALLLAVRSATRSERRRVHRRDEATA